MLLAVTSIYAQKETTFHPLNNNPAAIDLQSNSGPQAQPAKVHSMNAKNLAETISIGSTANVYSSILNGNNQVSYNSDLNSLVFIHRENGTSGNLRYDISTDGGMSWEVDMGPLTPSFDAGTSPEIGGGNRYPNMTIWNPEGNTDLSMAYMAGTGPALSNVTTTWGNLFQVSANLEGGDVSEVYTDVTGTLESFHPYGMYTANNAVWSLSTNYNSSTTDLERDTITNSIMYLNKGVFNETNKNFDWEVQDEFTADWVRYDTNTNGFDENFVGSYNLAFSPSGQVGYAVVFGVEVSTMGLDSVPRPVIWKTADGGDSWDRLPEFDFSTQQAFIDYIVYDPETQADISPYFSAFDLAVDANDRLHLFTHVLSAAVDLGFVYTDLTTQHMFHLTTSDGTDWTTNYVAPKLNNGDGLVGTIGLDERLQCGRSEDGNKIFFTWVEDDDNAEIIFPDIMSVGYDIVAEAYTAPRNLTVGTNSEEYSFWPSLSPTVISGGECYEFELPIVIAEPAGIETDPLQYYYLRGAGFDQVDFSITISVGEESTKPNVDLYPNPSSDFINIRGLANQQVDLFIYDVQGRFIESKSNFNSNERIDLSSLNAGIYMIQIVSESIQSTVKLVVE